MTTKKKLNRPPRSVWLIVDGEHGVALAVYPLRSVARAAVTRRKGARVVGPYILAERVRER